MYSSETDQYSSGVPEPSRRMDGLYRFPLLSTNPCCMMPSTTAFTAALDGVHTRMRGFTSFSFIWMRARFTSSSELKKAFLVPSVPQSNQTDSPRRFD